MTRKRFIKLLMSYGNQRNEANRLAYDVNNCYKCSYKFFIDYFKNEEHLDYLQEIIETAYVKYKKENV